MNLDLREKSILWEWNRDIVEISSSKWLTKWWMKLERQIWNGTGRQAYKLARGYETPLCS